MKQLLILATLLALSAEALEAGVRGEGGVFLELFSLAEKQCHRRLERHVGGRQITVFYGDEISSEAAARFADSVTSFHRERAADFDMLRQGLAYHLGPELWMKIANHPQLVEPEPESRWYLVVPSKPFDGIIWRGGPGSGYRIVQPAHLESGVIPAPVNNFELSVHSRTHFWLQALLTSERGRLPRWLEEGICDYVSMQFERWKHGVWDGPRETRARLAWERASIRKRMFPWPHGLRGGIKGLLQKWRLAREKGWESELMYTASLGLVVGLEHELGHYDLLEFFKQIIDESPETDEEVIQMIEFAAGKPLHEIGRLPEVARGALYDDLLARARIACEKGEGAGLPLHALGFYWRQSETVGPVLQSLSACEDPGIAMEGIEGLITLGRPDLVEDVLNQLPDEARQALDLRDAEIFERGRRRARRWFRKEWKELRRAS